VAESGSTVSPENGDRGGAGPVIRPTSMPLRRRRPAWHAVAGFAMVLPALVFLVTSYLEPTIWAVRSSLRTVDVLRGGLVGPGGNASTGGANYRLMLDNGFGRSLGFALSLAVVPLIVVTVLAPLLAWSANRAGTRARRTSRALLALPLACFAPVAVAVGWRIERVARYDAVPGATGLVREVTWLASLGLVCALAVTWYLAALRRIDAYRRPGPAMAAAGLLACLAVVAAALQTFSYPYVLVGGGGDTDPPLLVMLSTSLVRGEFGPAAAVATVLLAILAVLGVIATIVVLVTGMRLEVDREAPATAATSAGPSSPRARWPWAAILTGLLVAAVLGVSLYAMIPWLRHAASSGGLAAPLTGTRVLVNTWVPPLVSTGVGVAAAALAGFGIGALRPLGRASELLLLPFAPYLFVGIGPLALRAYAAGATADRLDSLIGLVPPTRLEVPALFLFTLLFRGQAMRAEQQRQRGAGPAGWWRGLLRPALPMIGLVALASWVVRAQDLLWPVLSGSGPHATGPVVLAGQLRAVDGSPGDPAYALVMPPLVLLVLIAIAVLAQVTYLDRVALRVGRPEYPGGPRT